MRELPILFSAPMVRAILEGRKTVTRRALKAQPPADTQFYRGSIGTYSGASRPRHFWGHFESRDAFLEAVDSDEPMGGIEEDILWPGGDDDGYSCDVFAAESGLRCPYGAAANDILQAGDRLWARETVRILENLEHGRARACYEADKTYSTIHGLGRLKPIADGRCVPNGCHREAARIWLEVTAVRVERLQDISEEQALAEGCMPAPFPGPWWQGYMDDGMGGQSHHQTCGDEPPEWMIEPRPVSSMAHLDRSSIDVFRVLWMNIYGVESWAANPWVWVVEFKRLGGVTP